VFISVAMHRIALPPTMIVIAYCIVVLYTINSS